MGYLVKMTLEALYVPPSQVPGCLGAINHLWSVREHNRFVSRPPGGTASSIEEAFAAWRYQVTQDRDGTVHIISFMGQKRGNDEHLYYAIAPFVGGGSIHVLGEDLRRWRYDFTDGEVYKWECQPLDPYKMSKEAVLLHLIERLLSLPELAADRLQDPDSQAIVHRANELLDWGSYDDEMRHQMHEGTKVQESRGE